MRRFLRGLLFVLSCSLIIIQILLIPAVIHTYSSRIFYYQVKKDFKMRIDIVVEDLERFDNLYNSERINISTYNKMERILLDCEENLFLLQDMNKDRIRGNSDFTLRYSKVLMNLWKVLEQTRSEGQKERWLDLYRDSIDEFNIAIDQEIDIINNKIFYSY